MDIDEMRKNMITFKPIPIEECLVKHKGCYDICKVDANTYETFCFACQVTKRFKLSDPPGSEKS